MTTKRSLSARELLKIAESADGQRGKELRLVEATSLAVGSGSIAPSSTDPEFRLVTTDDTPKDGDLRPVWRPLLEINTPPVNPSRANNYVEGTYLVSGAVRIQLPCEKYDALFWSEASVEKFFFPYYVRILDPVQFRKLHEAYYDNTGSKTIYGFVHYPPTDFDEIDPELKSFAITPEGLKRLGPFIEAL